MKTLSKQTTTLAIAMLLSGSAFAGTGSFTVVTPEEGFKRTHIQVGDFQRFQTALSSDFVSIHNDITANGKEIKKTQTDLGNLGVTVDNLSSRIDRLENKQITDFASLTASIAVNTASIGDLVSNLAKANKRIKDANKALIDAQADYNSKFSTVNLLINSNKTAVDNALADAKADLDAEKVARAKVASDLAAANLKLDADIKILSDKSVGVDLALGTLTNSISALNTNYQSILDWRADISEWRSTATSDLDDLRNKVLALTNQQNIDRQVFADGLSYAAAALATTASQIADDYSNAIALQSSYDLKIVAGNLEAKASQIANDYSNAIALQSSYDLKTVAGNLEAKAGFLIGLIDSAALEAKNYTNTVANTVRDELTAALAGLQSSVTQQIDDAQKTTKAYVTAYSDNKSQKIAESLLDIADKLNKKIGALYQISQPAIIGALNTATQIAKFDALEKDLGDILKKVDGFDGTFDDIVGVNKWDTKTV